MLRKLFKMYCGIQRIFNLGWLPPVIIWELTWKCNQRCVFCPYYGVDGRKPDFSKELSMKQIDEILTNIWKSYKFYKPHFGLTGGDIFVRNDIKEILQLFKKHKFSYSVTTNGLGLTEELINTLKDTGCKELRFSLHGLDKVHDGITRVPNSWNKTMVAISLAKEHLPVMINCVITDDNVEQLQVLLDSSKALKIPIRFQHLEWTTTDLEIAQLGYTYLHLGKQLPMKFGTTKFTKILKLSEFIKSEKPLQEPRQLSGFSLDKYYLTQEPFRKHCLEVFGVGRIDPFGNVYGCVDYYYGNLLKESMVDVWLSDKAKKFRRIIKRGLMPGCARCCKLS